MRRHKPILSLIFLPIALMAIGLIMMYTIGPAWAEFKSTGSAKIGTYSFFIKQLIIVVLSIVAMLGVWFLATRNDKILPWLFDNSLTILGIGLFACFLVGALGRIGFTMGGLIGCSGGACRAFNIPLLGSFQPAEFLKVGVILYVINIITKRKKEERFGWNLETMLPIVILVMTIAVIVAFLEKDLGSTVVMYAMIFCMLYAFGIEMKVWHWLGLGFLAVMLGLILVFSSPHRIERIGSFVSQTEGKEDAESSHSDNALLAIGSGGWFGVGIGNSVQATGYLPESINDSIFAVMGETVGFFGLVILLAIYAILLIRMLGLYDCLRDDKEKLIPIAVFAWIFGHVVINVMGMTGIIPMKGITLPFISYGGSSMILLSATVGLVVYVSCFAERNKNKRYMRRKPIATKTYSRRRRHD